MYLGRIVEIGSAADDLRQPRHPYTKALLEAIPEPDPATTCRVTFPGARYPTPPSRRSAARSTRAARTPSRPAGESRDLRTLLEERWAKLGARRSPGRRPVIGGLDGLDRAVSPRPLPCASGRSPTEVTALLEEHRAANPDDPFWRGVVVTEERAAGVAVRFHEGVDPVLGPGRRRHPAG